MICQCCGFQNEDVNFCIKCGTKLVANAQDEIAAGSTLSMNFGNEQSRVPKPLNPQAEKAKQWVSNYVGFLLASLKNPTRSALRATESQFINGIVTMVLYAFLIPLILYFYVKGLIRNFSRFFTDGDISLPFGSIVIKPTFYILIFLALTVAIVFVILKYLAKGHVDFKGLISRFGSFLVVPTALMFIALLFSIMKMNFFIFFLLLGLMALPTVIGYVIYSYKNDGMPGLDPLYSTLLVLIVLAVIFYNYGDNLLGWLTQFKGF